MGKNILKKAAPDIMHTALEAGNEILQGKSFKKMAKGALRNASRSLARNTRQSIEQELAQYGRCRTRGGLRNKFPKKKYAERSPPNS